VIQNRSKSASKQQARQHSHSYTTAQAAGDRGQSGEPRVRLPKAVETTGLASSWLCDLEQVT
jgi:hypothetical protein